MFTEFKGEYLGIFPQVPGALQAGNYFGFSERADIDISDMDINVLDVQAANQSLGNNYNQGIGRVDSNEVLALLMDLT